MLTASFFGITDYITYVIGVIAIILLPGPNSMYCLYVGSSQGIKKGYQSVFAIILGDFILMLAAVLGAAALIKTNQTVFLVFKAIGGAYLAYLGFNLLKSATESYQSGKKDSTQHKAEQDIKITKQDNVFLKALTLSLSNPKAIMFFLSFFLQFVDPTYDNPTLSFIILGITLQVFSFIYLSVLIFSGIKLVHFFNKKPFLGIIGNACIGCLFIGFAISLWLTSNS